MAGIEKPRRLPKDERKAQLTHYALVVAARRGIGRVTHAEVAGEAGVAVPTVFAYFPNREALVIGVVREVERFYVDQYSTCLGADVSPRQAIFNLFSTYSDSVNSRPECAIVWLEWSTSVRNEFGIWELFLSYQEHMIPQFAATIRKGKKDGSIAREISETDAARLIVASAYTITQLRFMGRGRRTVRHFIARAVDLALGEQPGRK